jgi:hypothetical protein
MRAAERATVLALRKSFRHDLLFLPRNISSRKCCRPGSEIGAAPSSAWR